MGRKSVRWVLVSAAGLGFVGVWAMAAAAPPPPKPCRATFERVAVGMTREQIVATVGAPEGNYADEGIWYAPRSLLRGEVEGSWLCNDCELLVFYDHGGRATAVTIRGVKQLRPRLTLRERIRRWAEW